MSHANGNETVYDLIREHIRLEKEAAEIGAKVQSLFARNGECRRRQSEIADAVAPAVQNNGPYFVRDNSEMYLVNAEGTRLELHKLKDAIELYRVAPGPSLAVHREDDGTLRVIPAEAATA